MTKKCRYGQCRGIPGDNSNYCGQHVEKAEAYKRQRLATLNAGRLKKGLPLVIRKGTSDFNINMPLRAKKMSLIAKVKAFIFK